MRELFQIQTDDCTGRAYDALPIDRASKVLHAAEQAARAAVRDQAEDYAAVIRGRLEHLDAVLEAPAAAIPPNGEPPAPSAPDADSPPDLSALPACNRGCNARDGMHDDCDRHAPCARIPIAEWGPIPFALSEEVRLTPPPTPAPLPPPTHDVDGLTNRQLAAVLDHDVDAYPDAGRVIVPAALAELQRRAAAGDGLAHAFLRERNLGDGPIADADETERETSSGYRPPAPDATPSTEQDPALDLAPYDPPSDADDVDDQELVDGRTPEEDAADPLDVDDQARDEWPTPTAVANAVRNLADAGTPATASAIYAELDLEGGKYGKVARVSRRLDDAIAAAIDVGSIEACGRYKRGTMYAPVPASEDAPAETPDDDVDGAQEAGESAVEVGKQLNDPDKPAGLLDGIRTPAQGGLSDRARGPVERADAEAQARQNGDQAPTPRGRVLAYLREHGPSTPLEISDALGRDDHPPAIVAQELQWLVRNDLAIKQFSKYRALPVPEPAGPPPGADLEPLS